MPLTFAIAAVLATAPAAALAHEHMKPFYQGKYLTPSVSVDASTAQAGGNPDIDIRIKKTPSACPGPLPQPYQATSCNGDEVHLEQNLKTVVTSLPPGLLANVNAAPACDLSGWPAEGSGVFQHGELGHEGEPACPAETQVGTVSFAWPNYCFAEDLEAEDPYNCWNFDPILVNPVGGMVFNGVARPGEQARLHVLIGWCDASRLFYPQTCDPETDFTGWYSLVHRVDISVRLRTESDWGADASTALPDVLCLAPYDPNFPGTGCPPLGTASWVPYSPDDMTIRLWGNPPGEPDIPFTANPTSCQPRRLAGSFQGYAQNAWESALNFGSTEWRPGEDDGLIAESSTGYPVTGCNSLDYSPELSMTLDSPLPAQPSAITSVVDQADGEQTTKQVKVEIPRDFRVNFKNTVAQCTDEQAAALSCPAEAQIGEVAAESKLLPETGDLAGPLRGEVFVGPTTSENIKLFTLLHGFVKAKLEGRLEVNSDGSSEAHFDLPEVPQDRIALTLYGGPEKALVTTPKACGTYTLKATFTAHQGTQVRRDVPVQVLCTAASFEAQMGSRKPRAHPTVTLAAASPDLRSVSFDLSRYLKVGADRARLTTLGRYGILNTESTDGFRDSKLKLLRQGRRGSLSFAATEAGAQVTGVDVSRVGVAHNKKRSSKRAHTGLPTRIRIAHLPAKTTKVSLELFGSKDSLIRNPASCKRRGKRLSLGFAAHVGTGAGTETLYRSVPMRCAPYKHSKRK